MKTTTRLLLFLPTFLLLNTAEAQNWTVGEQVDDTLSQLVLYGSSCGPLPDEAFNFSASTVTGVDHVAIVMAVGSSGSITVIPGPAAALALGDTIWLTSSVTREVYFASGSGSLSLVFKAIGTPTTVGQAYPCSESNSWMSDFGICPETLSLDLQNNCVTDNTTDIAEATDNHEWFTAPSAANGGHIEVRGVAPGSIQVLDIQGRPVNALRTRKADGGSEDMNTSPAGIYIVRAISVNGTPLVSVFAVVH